MNDQVNQEDIKQNAEFDALEGEIVDDNFVPGAAEQIAEPETAEIIQPILEMGFAILAPNWNVQPVESEQLAKAYGGLVDKYFPDGIGDYGLEVNAIMITVAIILPRIKLPRTAPPPQTEQEEPAE